MLENSKLFASLPAEELKALRAVATEQRYAVGQEIFKTGDAGDGLFLVKEGLVEIGAAVAQEQRHVFSQIGPGEVFGEMAVIEEKPRSATAVAREETTAYFIPRDKLLALVDHSPGLALALLQEISSRLREFNQQYLREVLQAERLAVVGRFARSIIHDLKNPLNIIGITSEMASMEGATPDIRRQAQKRISEQVERISEMISEILEFTQGPQNTFVLTQMDYGTLVNQLIDEARKDVGPRSVTITFENAPPQVSLLVNPKRLRRVFFNLIHNSVEAMPDGGRITLRFETKPNEVITEIEDTGPGLAPEIAGRLFEPFATFGKAHGTGLGLSICRRILEEHHGWINTRTEPPKGAIFAIGLPRGSKSR
jgi:signal transduction histidine kinase